jgi:hypothetical protein
VDPAIAAVDQPTQMDCTDEFSHDIANPKPIVATPSQPKSSAPAAADTMSKTEPPATWASTTRVPPPTTPTHPSLNAYFSKRVRHLNTPVVPRPLAQPFHMAVTNEASGTLAADPVILKLNKLTRPMIALTTAVATTTTSMIIEEANICRGVKLLPEKVRIFSCPILSHS